MTKTLKKTLLLILSALLLVTALIFVSPATARAEEVRKTEKYFEKLDGCRIDPGLRQQRTIAGKTVDVYPIAFSFKPTQEYGSSLLNIKTFAEGVKESANDKIDYEQTYMIFEFTLRHRPITKTEAGEERLINKKITVRQVFSLNATGTVEYAVSYLLNDSTYRSEYVTLPKHAEKNGTISGNTKQLAVEGGFTLENYHPNVTVTGPQLWEGAILFDAYLTSYEESYDVEMNFRAKRTRKQGFLNWGRYEEYLTAEPVFSDIRSVKQWLEISYECGTLEQEVVDYAEALLIATGVKIKDVKISYLVPVGDTPFATMETITVKNVPVKGTEIVVDDVRALTRKTFDIFGSTVWVFECVDEENYVYKPYYVVDSMVKAETKEGKEYNFFYNLNYSYADVFTIARSEGLITNDEYEWAMWQIYVDYPEALGDVENKRYYEKDLYGRFGIISLPEKNVSVQGAISSLLGKKSETLNINILYTNTSEITKDQYNALLNDYGYSSYSYVWEKAFAGATGTSLEATHYIFYAEPGEAKIEENDPVTPGISEGIKGFWKGASNLFKNLGGLFEGWTSSKIGALSIVVIVAGGYILIKTGLLKNLLSKSGSKKSKSKKKK